MSISIWILLIAGILNAIIPSKKKTPVTTGHLKVILCIIWIGTFIWTVGSFVYDKGYSDARDEYPTRDGYCNYISSENGWISVSLGDTKPSPIIPHWSCYSNKTRLEIASSTMAE